MTLNGIDVSNNNGPVNWLAFKGEISFAGIKVSEGLNFADQDAKVNIAGARGIGAAVIGYHFLHAGLSGSAQAEHFLSAAHSAGLRPGDLIAVDAEDGGLDGEDAAQMNLTASAFRAELQRHFAGYNPTVYTEPSMEPALTAMTSCPLWRANPDGIVVKASPWKVVSFTQTGQRGVDTDVFYGDAAALAKLAIPH